MFSLNCIICCYCCRCTTCWLSYATSTVARWCVPHQALSKLWLLSPPPRLQPRSPRTDVPCASSLVRMSNKMHLAQFSLQYDVHETCMQKLFIIHPWRTQTFKIYVYHIVIIFDVIIHNCVLFFLH
jgi:hypothetical protein